MFGIKLQLVVALTLVVSCSGQFDDKSQAGYIHGENVNEEQVSEQERRELENYIEGYLVTRDASGKIISIEGYHESQKIKTQEQEVLTSEELSALINDNDAVVSFDAPEGTEADISAPTMIIGSNLFDDVEHTLDCGSLDYGDEGTSLSEVFSLALVNDVCGKVSLGFCIRIIPKSGINASKGRYTYIPAPPIQLSISCDNPYKDIELPESQRDVSQEGSVIDELGAPISIGSSDFTQSQMVTLHFNADGADEMFVTNNAGCSDPDRGWEPYSTAKTDWLLSNTNAENKVYVKFKQGDMETICYEDWIIHDNIAPSKVTSIEFSLGVPLNNYAPLFSLDGANDIGSGIFGYELSIGTSEQNDDVSSWSLMGDTSSFNLANYDSANYVWGENYFVNIRPIDRAENIGDAESKLFTYGYRELGSLKLKAEGSEESQAYALATYADAVVVGSSLEDAKGKEGVEVSRAGVVRVYRSTPNGLNLEGTLKAPNPDNNDYFGKSVAIYQDTIVVGAPGEDSDLKGVSKGGAGSDNNLRTNSGAAFIFKREIKEDGKISWKLSHTIKAENADSNDQFGDTVGIFGSYIAVGAPREDSSSQGVFDWNSDSEFTNDGRTDSGAVYILKLEGSEDNKWEHFQFLKAEDSDSNGRFPQALAMADNTIAAGSSYLDNFVDGNGQTNYPGAAIVFGLSEGSWVQQAALKGITSESNARFGYSVAVAGNRVAVGAIGENSGEGSVYIFSNNGASWSQEKLLSPDFLSSGDQFGYGLSLFGNTLIIGSNRDDSETPLTNGAFNSLNNNLENSGSAFVYYFSTENSWTLRSLLKPSQATQGSFFGSSIGISESIMFVGSRFKQNSIDPGTLYLFGY